jgi:hypothetical protein
MFQEYINQISVLSAAGSAQLERLAKPKQLKKGEVLLDQDRSAPPTSWSLQDICVIFIPAEENQQVRISI